MDGRANTFSDKVGAGDEVGLQTQAGFASLIQGILSLPGITLSRDDIAFLKELKQKGFLQQFTDLTAFHVSPSYNRSSIRANGLRNLNSIFTEEQRKFLIEFKKRLPWEKTLGINVDSMVFGERDGQKRGIYLSFNEPQDYAYPIPESIRYYFAILSENFEYLSSDEQSLVIGWFRDFHTKLSEGTDLWKIRVVENPELFVVFFPWVKDVSNELPELFDGDTPIFDHPDQEFTEGISSTGLRLVRTIQKTPIAMWTMRCKNLLDRLQ